MPERTKVDLSDREQFVDLAAAAIANARGARRGVPEIRNILEVLPDKLREEVRDDARAVFDTLMEWQVQYG